MCAAVRNHVRYFFAEPEQTARFKQDLQDRAEEWMDRAAELAAPIFSAQASNSPATPVFAPRK